VGALPLSREARVQFPAGELGSHKISPDGARAGNLMRPRIGWGLPLVPDPIQSWRFREVCARKPRGPSLHRLGKIDAICTCIGTSDVKLMEFQSIKMNESGDRVGLVVDRIQKGRSDLRLVWSPTEQKTPDQLWNCGRKQFIRFSSIDMQLTEIRSLLSEKKDFTAAARLRSPESDFFL